MKILVDKIINNKVDEIGEDVEVFIEEYFVYILKVDRSWMVRNIVLWGVF